MYKTVDISLLLINCCCCFVYLLSEITFRHCHGNSNRWREKNFSLFFFSIYPMHILFGCLSVLCLDKFRFTTIQSNRKVILWQINRLLKIDKFKQWRKKRKKERRTVESSSRFSEAKKKIHTTNTFISTKLRLLSVLMAFENAWRKKKICSFSHECGYIHQTRITLINKYVWKTLNRNLHSRNLLWSVGSTHIHCGYLCVKGATSFQIYSIYAK